MGQECRKENYVLGLKCITASVLILTVHVALRVAWKRSANFENKHLVLGIPIHGISVSDE